MIRTYNPLSSSNMEPQQISILCNDSNGLSLVGNEIDSSKSGLLNSLLHDAATLCTDSSPIILIETDERSIIVREYDSLIVAIIRREVDL